MRSYVFEGRSNAASRPRDDAATLFQLRFRDLAERLRVPAQTYRLRCRDANATTVMLRGDFFATDFHSGLRVHATDAVEQQDAQTEMIVAPALTVSVLLEGAVTAAFDGRRFDHAAPVGATGKIWSLVRPTRLTRWTRGGQRVRKVNVSVTSAWLSQFDQASDSADCCLRPFMHSHMATQDWLPGETAVRLAQEVLAANRNIDLVSRLSLEMNAIGILREAFAACSSLLEMQASRVSPDQARLSKRDRDRAEAVCRYIDRESRTMLTLADIAAATGMSVSTLTRVFKGAYGITVIDYLRSRRFQRARHAMVTEGLSIQQAAHLAGYSSAANFATAFRRAFGYTPSQC